MAREPKPKFKIGDTVRIIGLRRCGVVDYIGQYDEHLGDRRYKVRDNYGLRKNWNGKSLKRGSCRTKKRKG